jgi:tetratricopeptide (TPR) repeat protein
MFAFLQAALRSLRDFFSRLLQQFAEPFRLITDFQNTDSVDELGDPVRPAWQRLLLAPWAAIVSLFETLGLFVQQSTPSETLKTRRKFLRFGLPSALFAAAILVALFIHILTGNAVHNRYLKRLDSKAKPIDSDTIRRVSNRVLAPQHPFAPADRFDFAQRLSLLGDSDRAQSIIEHLAPSDSKGYANAHRSLALNLAPTLRKAPVSEQSLQTLQWHLQNSSELKDPDLLELRTDYFLAVGQIDRAIASLSQLAEAQPDRWFPLAELLLARGDQIAARSALSRAAQIYSQRMSENPQSIDDRLRTATAMARLGELDPAIEILNAGWRFEQDPAISNALSELFLLKYQKARLGNGAPEALWQHLQQSRQWNPSNKNAYEAIVMLHSDPGSTSIRSEIRKQIEQWISESPQATEPLFALSNLDAQEGKIDQAIESLEKVLSFDPNSSPALNNLAWLIASNAPPHSAGDTPEELRTNTQRLERLTIAEKYSRAALAESPDSSSFHDTLGTILLKQSRSTEALAEFEVSLRTSKNPIQTLETISKVYLDIGESDLADDYQQRADQLKKNTSTKSSSRIQSPPPRSP